MRSSDWSPGRRWPVETGAETGVATRSRERATLSDRPELSVIVPVLDGRDVLRRSIAALLQSDLPRDRWELIVVDDGSTDGSGECAEAHADQVLRIDGGPRGPGFARNAAAEVASGDILVFVDADVCVHREVLGKFLRAFDGREDLGAVFGAYDDQPTVAGLLSQYRNLFHRYVHLKGAGETETFWAGCGAVRRDLFRELGGFDVERYARPQIEDIELGYRIRSRGYRILLDPSIQGTHMKRWTLGGMVKTDLLDRGVPWMLLMLEDGPGGAREATLNVGIAEKVKIALLGVATLLLAAAAALRDGRLAALAIGCVAIIALLNLPVYGWFAERRSVWFAVRVLPLNLLYYFISGLAVLIALVRHVMTSTSRQSETVLVGRGVDS